LSSEHVPLRTLVNESKLKDNESAGTEHLIIMLIHGLMIS